MSMYDRARRPDLYHPCSTGEVVGPGSYDPQIAQRTRINADGYAPFLSMTSRETHISPQDTTIAAPGPGQYDPRQPSENIKGGSSVSNRSRRFVETENLVPGPGHYNVRQITEDDRQRPKQAYKENRPRLVIERKPDAPSIPTPGQAYGFEENDDGTLRRQDPPSRDVTIGPAYYVVENLTTQATKVYKGNHWGKMSSKRTDLAAGKEGPGPGQYEGLGAKEQRAENLNLPGKAKYQPRLPRYHEIIEKEEEKKGVPGPGKYDIKSAFEQTPSKLNAEGVEVEHPPFGVQAKRFHGFKDAAVPAPGQYNDPRTAFGVLKKPSGLKRTPFGQTSVRFVMEHNLRKTPGPGAYNSLGLGTESMRKAYIESTRRGVFGTTSPRIQPMVKRDDYFTPGPTHYQPIEKVHEAQEVKPTSVFSSLTTRLPEDPEVKAVPPPGSYNVDDSFKNSQTKKDPAPARTAAARRRQEAFKSSSSRFAPPHDVTIDKSDPMNPGPGTYDPNVKAITLKGGLMVIKEERFKELRKDEIPGPGHYEFSPLLQDTVLKGTFNATLGNPVAPRLRNSEQIRGQHAFLLGV